MQFLLAAWKDLPNLSELEAELKKRYSIWHRFQLGPQVDAVKTSLSTRTLWQHFEAQDQHLAAYCTYTSSNSHSKDSDVRSFFEAWADSGPSWSCARQTPTQLALPAPDQPVHRFLECDCVTGLIPSYKINSELAILWRHLKDGLWMVVRCCY